LQGAISFAGRAVGCEEENAVKRCFPSRRLTGYFQTATLPVAEDHKPLNPQFKNNQEGKYLIAEF